jgi:hypothetical protein
MLFFSKQLDTNSFLISSQQAGSNFRRLHFNWIGAVIRMPKDKHCTGNMVNDMFLFDISAVMTWGKGLSVCLKYWSLQID